MNIEAEFKAQRTCNKEIIIHKAKRFKSKCYSTKWVVLIKFEYSNSSSVERTWQVAKVLPGNLKLQQFREHHTGEETLLNIKRAVPGSKDYASLGRPYTRRMKLRMHFTRVREYCGVEETFREQ
jgi:hypothetical protein